MKLFITAFFYLLSIYGYAQNSISVKLKNNTDSGNHSFIYTQERIQTPEKFEIDKARIPKDIHDYNLRVIRFQPSQFYGSAYRSGLIDSNYLKKKDPWGYGNPANSCGFSYRNNFYFLVGRDINNKQLLIVDENNDFDFTNDTRIGEDEISTKRSKRFSVVAFICYNREFKKVDWSLWPFFDTTLATHTFNRMDQLSFESASVKEGYYKNKQTCIKLSIETGYKRVFMKGDAEISFASCENQFPIASPAYIKNQIGDTIGVSDMFYRIDSIDLTGTDLQLTKLDNVHKAFGFNPGDYGKPFSVKDFLTNEPLNSADLQHNGKYIVLDFWGTWCGPCIEAIPALAEIHRKYRNREVEFISVAVERKMDTALVKKDINEYHLDWHNTAMDGSRDFVNSLPSLYRVSSFPTTILISPAGVILLRTKGKNEMHYLDEKLGEIFSK